MEYIQDIVIKEEVLSEDEDTSNLFEDEEKVFMEAPIKFEYPEDDNSELFDERAGNFHKHLYKCFFNIILGPNCLHVICQIYKYLQLNA